mgnify:CR=1 FL=1
MSNNYKSANSEIVGREGMMYNEATEKIKVINYPHHGIFSNDNTYAITFNVELNRPPTKFKEHKPVRPPHSNEHRTKGLHEPPVGFTDNFQYLHYDRVKPPPLLPPYLKKPEDLARIQGLSNEPNKGEIIYGPTHRVNVSNIVY